MLVDDLRRIDQLPGTRLRRTASSLHTVTGLRRSPSQPWAARGAAADASIERGTGHTINYSAGGQLHVSDTPPPLQPSSTCSSAVSPQDADSAPDHLPRQHLSLGSARTISDGVRPRDRRAHQSPVSTPGDEGRSTAGGDVTRRLTPAAVPARCPRRHGDVTAGWDAICGGGSCPAAIKS